MPDARRQRHGGAPGGRTGEGLRHGAVFGTERKPLPWDQNHFSCRSHGLCAVSVVRGAGHDPGTRRRCYAVVRCTGAALQVALCRRRRAEGSPDASHRRQSPRLRRMTALFCCRRRAALNPRGAAARDEVAPSTVSVPRSRAAASAESRGCRQPGQLHQLSERLRHRAAGTLPSGAAEGRQRQQLPTANAARVGGVLSGRGRR